MFRPGMGSNGVLVLGRLPAQDGQIDGQRFPDLLQTVRDGVVDRLGFDRDTARSQVSDDALNARLVDWSLQPDASVRFPD